MDSEHIQMKTVFTPSNGVKNNITLKVNHPKFDYFETKDKNFESDSLRRLHEEMSKPCSCSEDEDEYRPSQAPFSC